MKKIHDDDAAAFEPFSKHKDRRKPKGRRSVHELYREPEPGSSLPTFSDPELQTLFERNYLSRILGELKSGKEATVYLAENHDGLVAAKIYRDQAVRSFKNDQPYRQGRFIGDARTEKAIRQRSKRGLGAQQALWIAHEYQQLWELYQAGLPVPKPLVGPGPDDIGMAGRVVLMSFIGDEHGAAPRLSDLRLNLAEAQAAWRQSVALLARLLALGKVHGDFSAYNLLWWRGEAVLIDFPQVVSLKENPQAGSLLERDVRSLCSSFRRHGIDADPEAVLLELRRHSRSLR